MRGVTKSKIRLSTFLYYYMNKIVVCRLSIPKSRLSSYMYDKKFEVIQIVI